MSPALARTFSSLKVPNYRKYFSGQLASITGNWMQTVGEMWLMVKLTGSGSLVGLTAGLQFLPILLFGAWGGLLADRRSSLVAATEAGDALLAATRERKDMYLAMRLDRLSPEELAVLERAAGILERVLEEGAE